MKTIVPLLWVTLIIAFAIFLEKPLSVKPKSKDSFSALNTEPHLKKMASEFHFMGTEANFRVRDYIIAEFRKLNIQVELFTGYSKTSFRGNSRIAKTENIIATIRGTERKKSVVFAGHYDSVLSAPGAADDVHAVACMIETARLLKNERLKNDIVFLITDGEEMGLLGAKAFVENRPLDDIGLLFNYEARGNSGAGMFFEWSDGNAWLVNEMRKACNRPIANSMAYEIYNKLPNDTDFTHFKAAGIKGTNHAFIDGFSYYHNPVDNPENININSVQHTGENMWRLAKHFGNLDLEKIDSKKNASFFNFFGLLVIYPSSMDLLILILGILMIILCLYKEIKQGLSIKSLLISFIAILFNFSVIIISCIGVAYILFQLYPQYDHFYTGQYYNHKWYILPSSGIAILSSWLFYVAFKKNKNQRSIQSAALMFLGLLSILIYLLLPTAAYLLTLPTLTLALFHYASKNVLKDSPAKNDFLKYILSIIPLGLWGPVIIPLFLAFSIKLLFAPALIVALICMAASLLFTESWISKYYPSVGIGLVLIGLTGAHIESHPTKEKPVPSSLYYLYDLDTENAYWLSDDPSVNDGNRSALIDAAYRDIAFPNRIRRLSAKAVAKPSVSIPTLQRDSVRSKLILKSDNEVFKTRILVKNSGNLKELTLNGYQAIKNSDHPDVFASELLGFTQDSLEIKWLKIDPNKSDTLWINSMMMGMPKKHSIPENYKRKDNYSAIVRSIVF